MKALIVPDTPLWKRNRYQLMNLLKEGEAVLMPFSWGYENIRINSYRKGLHAYIHEYKSLKYIAVVKNNQAKNQ